MLSQPGRISLHSTRHSRSQEYTPDGPQLSRSSAFFRLDPSPRFAGAAYVPMFGMEHPR
jgi:hypothetical protein